MKKTLIFLMLLFSSFVFFGQKDTYFLEITFNDGPFKGTHIFTPEKGNYLSQINLEFHKGVSNINASKLVAKNGLQIHYINRHFLGEAKVGILNAKKYTSGCGSLNFIDLENKQPYKKIDGDFIGCTPIKITKVGQWEKSIVKSRRTVSGSFTDVLEMKFRMDDGTKKTLKTTVTVKFKVRESRRK
ncbi:MAG: hypothetical protein HWD85_09625 [Flavobacteriaceae bacterium]|nr:hypothetical protein [Flavobacteriaceae bacterium]